jgi:hypothetical protein
MNLKRSGGATFDGKVDIFEYLIGNIVRVSSVQKQTLINV